MKLLGKIALVTATIALGGLAACSHDHKQFDEAVVRKHVLSKLEEINATEAQKAKICPLVEGIIGDCRDLHQRNKGLLRKVAGCLLQEKPNAAWLHSTVDEKTQEAAAFLHRSVDSFIEISRALDGEQRAKLQKKVEAAVVSHP